MGYRNSLWITLCLIGLALVPCQAQEEHQASHPGPSWFVNLYHQHQDFFGKPFSFQGMESGLILDRHWYIGGYGSCFASRLTATVESNRLQVWIGQAGLLAGYLGKGGKKLYPGVQVSGGSFWMYYTEWAAGNVEGSATENSLQGRVITPSCFVAYDPCKWFNVRMGLSYPIYRFEAGHFERRELDHLSFTFGLVFRSVPNRRK
ncbi:MAG: hypothetical protein LWW85_10045 [Marinilabiliales bacterium]|nr:hypothetical protein [Marinilabiliales bacterium]